VARTVPDENQSYQICEMDALNEEIRTCGHALVWLWYAPWNFPWDAAEPSEAIGAALPNQDRAWRHAPRQAP
jgi:hypothetical protein